MAPRPIILATVVVCILGFGTASGAPYLGKFLGKLTELHHGVSGEVYAVDARTLHIKDFTYDGQGPAAYFFAGNSRAPGNTGFRIRDENGSPDVLRRYRKEGVTITLPEGKSLNNIKWFSVWCEEFEVNFGDVKIPKNFDYPRPQKIDGLQGVHSVASENIVIVDAQTLLVPSLSYDGEAPDAKFWVGRGAKPTPQGIRVPDENGKEIPLRRYDRKTVVLTLPGELTVFDIGHFGIWCEAFTVDFGHVQIPQALNVPPSLKMLGVSPQSKLNCEVLHDDLAFEVRWAVAGDSVVLQLVAKLENREYMSFGISGAGDTSAMVGGDVVVAWVDKETLKGYAEDYYLEAKAQCSGPRGSCPDAKLADNSNNIRLLNAAMVNGYSIVTYQRPLRPTDIYDKQILTNASQPVIWAIGPLNQRDEVSFHSQYNKYDKFIDFGRPAKWNCPMPEGDHPSMKTMTSSARPVQQAYIAEEPVTTPTTTASRTRGRHPERRGGSAARDNERSQSRVRGAANRGTTTTTTTTLRPMATPAPVTNRRAWDIPPIQCDEPDDGVFYAQLGPTGGKHGYPAITGHVGWGISWYINGLLIPVINVVRGTTYTFVVEGGLDPDVPAKYHPFYITDDPIGGYAYKTAEERKNVKIFAGARQAEDGSVHPTGVGRLCHWDQQGDADADQFDSFGAYQRTLQLKCDIGNPGVIQWTPDKNTPDTVYYQCFSHRYLGWKINVLDSCDIASAGSEVHETIVLAPDTDQKADLAGSPSIRVETRVTPNNIEEILNKNEEIITTESIIKSNTSAVKTMQELPSVEKKYVFRTEPQIRKNITVMQPHKVPAGTMPMIMPMGKLVLRKQPLSAMASVVRPHFVNKPLMKVRRPTVIFKKPYYKTPLHHHHTVMLPVKQHDKPILIPMPSNNRPHIVHAQHPPQNVIIMKPQSKFIIPQRLPEPLKLNTVPHVEVSKLQASTERLAEQPNNFSEKPVMKTTPKEKHYTSVMSMKQAINTGFDPATVVIESGFKPIITKEIQSRISDAFDHDQPTVEIESEAGVIDETQQQEVLKEAAAQATEYFEPMFIPSPTIDMKKAMKKKLLAYKQQQQQLQLQMQGRRSPQHHHHHHHPHPHHHPQREYEYETAANERVDSYYLPPAGNKRHRIASNADMAPSTVIAFDGKKVSGASLTARGGATALSFAPRTSKASELLRYPQFVPFSSGDLPPLNAAVNFNAPQLQAATRVLNRELDVPLESRKQRRKRAAHHTPEHTAQQEAEAQSGSSRMYFNMLLVCLLLQLQYFV